MVGVQWFETLSIVVPLFNEEHRVSILNRGILEFLQKTTIGFTVCELILVNDGSRDNTLSQLQQLKFNLESKPLYGTKVCQVHIVNLGENQGKGYALKSGVAEAGGEWVLTMDADIATHPLELDRWCECDRIDWRDRNAVHIASREHRESKVNDLPTRRLMGRTFNHLVQFLSDLELTDTQCGFKIYPRDIALLVFGLLNTSGWAHDVELMMRLKRMNIPIQEHPVEWTAVANSRINPVRDAIKMSYEVLRMRILMGREPGRSKSHE